MFAKKNRLAKDRDVKTVLKAGRSFFDSFFTIKYLATNKDIRCTVVVSTKVAKQAVRRNKIKRVIRELFRGLLLKLPLGDYMIIVRPEAAKHDSADIRLRLSQVLVRSRLLK